MHKKIQKMATLWANGRDRTKVILNGVIGDTLEETGLRLAIQMTLLYNNQPVSLTRKSLNQTPIPPTGKICILAHGSCGSEKGWSFKEDSRANYGALLQKDFGFTPLFLRYNSGLHISTNGKQFSDLLEKFITYYPGQANEIILIGHSMGGLVFRSACHYGKKEKKKWVRHIKKIFYLGSPHKGTHLEKLGNITTTVLNQIPHPIIKIIVTLSNLRSAGVKDLRHGSLTDEEWQHKKAQTIFFWPSSKIPLLKNAEHYLICGTLSKVPGSRLGRFFGDGLVHPASGTGQGIRASNKIPFLENNCQIITGISHQRLQRSRRVYSQIKKWVNTRVFT